MVDYDLAFKDTFWYDNTFKLEVLQHDRVHDNSNKKTLVINRLIICIEHRLTRNCFTDKVSKQKSHLFPYPGKQGLNQ